MDWFTIDLDLSKYTFMETIIILLLIGIIVISALIIITRFLKNKKLQLFKDWIKIEESGEREDSKENVDKFVNRKNNKDVAVMLNRDRASNLFFELKNEISKEIKSAEKTKYKAVIFFGSIIENVINKIASEYVNSYEALLLSKTHKSSIEHDIELLKDYKNFSRTMKVISEQERLKISSEFQEMFEECLESKNYECIKDLKYFAKNIIIDIKKSIKDNFVTDKINKEEFIKSISELDKELYNEASKDLENISKAVNSSVFETIKKMKNIDTKISNTLSRIYE